MPARKIGLPEDLPENLAAGLAAIRAAQGVPDDFPPEVLRAAEAAAASPRLPELDRTELELITIDPPGARDLDQALHLRREGDGFVVSYAIADVAAFVSAGDPVDVEAHRRGMTFYAPDRRTPLHPPALSEGAASLLPDQVRPAVLWTITLDGTGATTGAEVVRALVRSREQLTYEQAQVEIDGGSARESLVLLAVVGPLREQLEVERGGVSLEIPEQEIQAPDGEQGWRLTLRAPLPVEGWNAQISLLTGMAAAQLMMLGRVGLLRTMPPADPGAVRRLRQIARALDIDWPADRDYPDFVRSLDPRRPAHAAMINACTSLFRGAGYQAFAGTLPEQTRHAAIAAEYAHVTAPLRRLIDRYAGEICLALHADRPVPDWVLAALEALPAEMQGADRRAKLYERSIIDLMEACLLQDAVGQIFTGTVIEVDRDKPRGTVMIDDPAVEARVSGDDLPLGQQIQVRLVTADVVAGQVAFEVA